jgi:hypothetical protein
MRARILSLLCLLCASSLVLTSCTQIATPNPPTQIAPATYLYTGTASGTSSASSSTILSFPAAFSGIITAPSSVTASTSTIYAQVTSDTIGKLYAIGYAPTLTANAINSFTVYVYTIPSIGGSVSTTGVLAASRNFPVSSTNGLTGNFASMAADALDNTYISQSNGKLAVYPSTATNSSNNTATNVYSLVPFSAMTTDAAANLFAAGTGTGMIYEFLNGFTTSATTPTAIRALNVSATVTNITSIAVDSSDTVYVLGTPVGSSTPAVFVFPLGTGTEAPARTISGSNTTFNTPGAIAVDHGNNIYVQDFSTTTTGHQDILEFLSTANGNVAPVVVITDSAAANVMGGYGLVAW